MDALFDLVKHRVTRIEFEAALASREREFGGLLNREALAHLLVDEMGLLPREAPAVAAAPAPRPQPERMEGIVREVRATRSFRRADGTTGFVADLLLEVEGRLRRIVLWDEAVRSAKALSPGSRVVLDGLLGKTGRDGGAEWHSARGFSVAAP